LFCTIGPRPAPLGPRPTLPAGNWVRFASLAPTNRVVCTTGLRRPGAPGRRRRPAASRCTIRSPNPQSAIETPPRCPASGNWLCFARWGHGRLLLPTSNFTLQNSPIYKSPPITRRVAGIGPEKWVARLSEIAVSSCPETNKENLRAGPFLVLDCCTNENIAGVSEARGSCRRGPAAPAAKRSWRIRCNARLRGRVFTSEPPAIGTGKIPVLRLGACQVGFETVAFWDGVVYAQCATFVMVWV
jgi:hypothetical protein